MDHIITKSVFARRTTAMCCKRLVNQIVFDVLNPLRLALAPSAVLERRGVTADASQMPMESVRLRAASQDRRVR
jgi:hypothetical protein